MPQLDGKQIKNSSTSLDKLSGTGIVTFNGGSMSFGVGSTLRQQDENIIIGHDVVNKNYVDSVAQGLNIKESVHVIATSSITLYGTQSIDNHLVDVGERVLVNGQDGVNATSSNGIYVVSSASWSRATDADSIGSTGEVQVGDFVFVGHGDLYSGTGWVLNLTDSLDFNILVGTESQHWTQFSSAGVITAGSGLVQTGNQFDVNVGSGLTVSMGNAVELTTTGVTAGSYGSATEIPTFEVDIQGRLISVGTVSLDLTSGNQTIAIGPAPDGTYGDGIFTTFTSSTPIGTAIDEINEILLLLAPTPPGSWAGSITSVSFTNTSYSPRALTTGSTVNRMFISTTPTLTNIDSVGTQSSAKVDTNGFTFSLVDNGSIVGTATLSGTYTVAKTSGLIRHSASVDPYVGVSGKAGFWKGITSFDVTGTLPTITPSSSQRLLELYYPSGGYVTYSYYIDNPLVVSIGTITATVPAMTSYISGVPTLTTSQTVTSIAFTINNVSSYFYAATSVYQINDGLIAGSTGDPDVIPSSYGETGSVTGKSGVIQSGQFSDLSFSFTVRGRNSIGTYGSNNTFTSTTHRVDTVSNETSRKTSGSGNYPSSGYNGVFDSSQSLVSTYTDELQLRNGLYVYPTINYTSVTGGPNYSGASGIRWVTFNLGGITGRKAFTITINGLSGISNQINNSNFYLEVKVDGSSPSKWVDVDSAYTPSTPNPGNMTSGIDGDPASDQSYAGISSSKRRVNLGSAYSYTGDVIVRIGWNQALSSVQFSSISISDLA